MEVSDGRFCTTEHVHIRVMNYGTGSMHKASLGLILCVPPWFHVGSRISINVFLVVKTDWTVLTKTVLKMRSVHESSKWFTELQTWATLFRHVEDSRIAHHRRNTWQTYCLRLVHLMGFCPSLVFWRCRHDICFCDFFVFLLDEFSTQKVYEMKARSHLPNEPGLLPFTLLP
jgi:hypothetical protein